MDDFCIILNHICPEFWGEMKINSKNTCILYMWNEGTTRFPLSYERKDVYVNT